jgi:hypothetical protein
MDRTMVVQRREITSEDIGLVRQLIETNPFWNRTRLSKELCLLWNWRAPNGQIKDMACRTFLCKLEQRGYLTLPPSQQSRVKTVFRRTIPYVPHPTTVITGSLDAVAPVYSEVVEGRSQSKLFKYLLSRYHYLGWSGIVGENMKYLVFDRKHDPLACLLFGSAAWKSAPRDDFIGWDAATREANLQLLTNNMRFLILPWVRVLHLASHILGQVARRISSDWMARYNHPIYLLETFVERERFRGVCYQAANWIYVGQTKGRSRNDRYATLKVPIKDSYLYPLTKRFRETLTHEA